jgi:hypothetical protein
MSDVDHHMVEKNRNIAETTRVEKMVTDNNHDEHHNHNGVNITTKKDGHQQRFQVTVI